MHQTYFAFKSPPLIAPDRIWSYLDRACGCLQPLDTTRDSFSRQKKHVTGVVSCTERFETVENFNNNKLLTTCKNTTVVCQITLSNELYNIPVVCQFVSSQVVTTDKLCFLTFGTALGKGTYN